MYNLFNKLFYVYDMWGIGIYEGDDIHKIYHSKNTKVPVLSGRDVTDCKARFVADPFMIKHDNVWYMFFEIYDDVKSKGLIGVATSNDAYSWEYKNIVLEEDFHLSYPYVFELNNKIYMMPETAESGYIKIYEAINFPYEWKCISNIIEGKYWDPSFVIHDNKFWIFAKGEEPYKDSLYLFYSDSLECGWKPHCSNPIIKEDSVRCRPGGRVIKDNGKLYRYSQDCSVHYGKSIIGFEIENITVDEYKEKELGVIIKGSDINKTWNKDGMHTVDIHNVNDKYLVAVDGFYYKKVNKISRNIEFLFRKIKNIIGD